MTKRRSTTSWRRQRGSFAVWPVKSHHQMPIKSCPKMILLEKWKLLEPLQKLWAVGQNNYCHRIWKVAKSGINRPIWSHWSFAKVNWPTRLIPYILDSHYHPYWLSPGAPMLMGPSSVTRLGNFLHCGQPFKSGGNNYFTQIAHIVRQFL